MSSRINEIKLDIEDLNSLLETATRQKSKDILTLEIRKLQTELINLSKKAPPENQNKSLPKLSNNGPKCYEVKLNNYAWDQSDDFIKIYVTLNKVKSLPEESVYCYYTERSMELNVLGLENKNYQLPINNLSEEIIPEKCYHKVKTDMILICLAKKKKKNWSCITSVEKRLKDAKEASKADLDKTNPDDPSAGLMSIMKKMYDEGDDKLKQTIAQAWTQSAEKRAQGMDMGLPDL